MRLIDLITRYVKKKKIPKKVIIGGAKCIYDEEINDYMNERTGYGYFSSESFFVSDLFRDIQIIKEDKHKVTIDDINAKITKLEQALDKIKSILDGAGEMYCHSKSMCLYEEDIEDILEIIQKAKGDIKNEN